MGHGRGAGVSAKNIDLEKKGLYILTIAMTITDIVKVILILLEIPAIVFMVYMLIDAWRDR